MMNQGPNILKIQRSKKGQKKAQGTQPHLKDTSMFQSKKMAKKGRKKVKKAQKKSPEEAKAEVVEILVTIFFFIFLFQFFHILSFIAPRWQFFSSDFLIGPR